MNYKIERENDCVVLKLAWEFWQSDFSHLEDILSKAYKEWSDLVLDMWEVTYINSAVIWGLVWFYNRVNENLDKIIVWFISPEVEQAFELIWISRIIKILWNNKKAIKYSEESSLH